MRAECVRETPLRQDLDSGRNIETRAAFAPCMAYSERLARLTYYVLAAALVGIVLGAAQRYVAKATLDPQTGSAGLAVETDAGTGCQYVVTPWGGIFVRLDADGKPLCKPLKR